MRNFFKRERQFSQTEEKRLTVLNQFCQQAFTEPLLCVILCPGCWGIEMNGTQPLPSRTPHTGQWVRQADHNNCNTT